MRIAIVHYHLHLGGVTRVIQNAVSSLADQEVEAVVLTGEPPEPQDELTQSAVVVAGLGYDEQSAPYSAAALGRELEAVAATYFGAAPDLWHFHNHSLGKNLAVPEAVVRLATRGCPVLLQVHDFPEDGRPANYGRLLEHLGRGDTRRLSSLLYPQAAQVHYAVLNSRDRSFLAAAGVPDRQLHLLPNAVALPASPPPEPSPEPPAERPQGPRLWLYPTRAIRRKNLGEFLFWSALQGGEEDQFATTLGPRNPRERPIYEAWVGLAASLKLPVTLELAAQHPGSFAALLSSAHALVTTSVAEGFGLAFLEPWLLGRPVVGRNLTEITAEFETAGVALDALYDRLEVPLEWIGRDVLEEKIVPALKTYLKAYGREPHQDDLERVLSAWVVNGRVDLGRLDEPLQERLIRRLVNSPTDRALITPPRLAGTAQCESLLVQNRDAVLNAYGPAGYGKRLKTLYQQILESPIETLSAASGEKLLDAFLAPERLFLLRT
jgi:glycosyltransferase involved in cell wall biosynthesis